jgi:hypothetical protein
MIGVEMSRLRNEFFNAGYELGINNFQFPGTGVAVITSF